MLNVQHGGIRLEAIVSVVSLGGYQVVLQVLQAQVQVLQVDQRLILHGEEEAVDIILHV